GTHHEHEAHDRQHPRQARGGIHPGGREQPVEAHQDRLDDPLDGPEDCSEEVHTAWSALSVSRGDEAESGEVIVVQVVARLRHVIDAALRPRVAAQDSPRAQCDALDDPVLLDGAHRVRRAARVVAAHVTVDRGDDGAIAAEDRDAHVPRQQPEEETDVLHRLNAGSGISGSSAERPAQSRWAAPGRARTTTSAPLPPASTMERQTARIRRRTRFLSTALPTVLATMNPNRAGSLGSRSIR